MKKKNDKSCYGPMHSPKCFGSMLLILGVLVLLNSVFGWFSWGVFIGGILILKAIIVFIHPHC